MKKTVEADYENGVFRPLKNPTWLNEHRRVTLTVTADEGVSSLADCVNRISSEDAREMLEIVEREFETVDPRDWK